jgi:hypothetical protein
MEIRFDSLESWERGGRRWHLLEGATSVKVEEMRKISSDDVPKMLQALLADRFQAGSAAGDQGAWSAGASGVQRRSEAEGALGDRFECLVRSQIKFLDRPCVIRVA